MRYREILVRDRRVLWVETAGSAGLAQLCTETQRRGRIYLYSRAVTKRLQCTYSPVEYECGASILLRCVL
ncbi:hypothetical protein MHYP_G00023920 [Metynnis hypsauchen]